MAYEVVSRLNKADAICLVPGRRRRGDAFRDLRDPPSDQLSVPLIPSQVPSASRARLDARGMLGVRVHARGQGLATALIYNDVLF